MSMRVCIRQHSSYLFNQRHSHWDFKAKQISKGDLKQVDRRQFSDSRTVMAEANPTNGFFSMGLNTLKVWNMERRNEERASRRGREAKKEGRKGKKGREGKRGGEAERKREGKGEEKKKRE